MTTTATAERTVQTYRTGVLVAIGRMTQRVARNAIANVNRTCRRGCGRLYKDWYGELVCPICGYHEYEEEHDRCKAIRRLPK